MSHKQWKAGKYPYYVDLSQVGNKWEENCWYLVEVSLRPSNPIWRAMFYTGFLDEEGNPAGYNKVHSSTVGTSQITFRDIYYLKAIRQVSEPGETTFKFVESPRMPDERIPLILTAFKEEGRE